MLSLAGLLAVIFIAHFFRANTQLALNDYQQHKMYQHIVEDYLAGKETAVTENKDLDALAFLRTLQRHLQTNSEDSQAWMILGNALQGVDNNRHSLMAYQRAYRVNRNDQTVALAYVNARLSLLAEQQTLDIESIDILNNVLATDAQHENALMLLGVVAYQGKDFVLAIDAWQRLLVALQARAAAQGQELPESVLTALQTSIEKAKVAQTNEQSPASEAVFSLALHIIFSEEALYDLKNHLSSIGNGAASNPVLFVYARKPKQKGMPLAAIRYALNTPAATVDLVLTNQHSLAGIDLSKLETLELSARVSFSGQAIAESGDWQSDAFIINSESFTMPQQLIIDKTFANTP